MTSPIPPKSSGRETSAQRLITPAVQVVTAAIILFTGAGVAAIFWQMPTGSEYYDLCQADVVDKDLAAVPLPHESVAVISPEAMQQIVLPTLGVAPTADSGAEKYAQAYDPPASLESIHPIENKTPILVEEESPVALQKFEPMRHIVEKKPIVLEPVDHDFLPKPESVSTAEKSDEMLSKFHFAENGKSDYDTSSVPLPPTDPFPLPQPSESPLQPLQPLSADGLSPLLPLLEEKLQPLAAL